MAQVKEIASQILAAWRGSVEGIFKAAGLVAKAREQFGPNVFQELAGFTSISRSTLSKLYKIHEQRDRLQSSKAELPASWTTLYALALLNDDQFKRLVHDAKLRPDLTIEVINRYATPSAAANPEAGFFAFATVQLPQGSNEEACANIRRAIERTVAPVLKGTKARLVFRESKLGKRGRNPTELSEKLKALLINRLAEFENAHSKLTPLQYEQLENAAWQHHHKQQKGAYPYQVSDPKSVENEQHPYSIKGKHATREAFFDYLRTRKIITPYNPISHFDDLGNARNIKLAYEYCAARTPMGRDTALRELKRLAAKKGPGAIDAKKHLDMIGEGA